MRPRGVGGQWCQTRGVFVPKYAPSRGSTKEAGEHLPGSLQCPHLDGACGAQALRKNADSIKGQPIDVMLCALRKIADSIKGQSIDVVLYVDRLDLYRVDALDKGVSTGGAVIEACDFALMP
eukprot:1139412-Pelagomonas_calceolata.AAC.3